jgi:hypothetical protein
MKTLLAATLLTIALVFFANGTNEALSDSVSQGSISLLLGILILIPGVITLMRPSARN